MRVMRIDENSRFQLPEVYSCEGLAKVNTLDGYFIVLAKVFPARD